MSMNSALLAQVEKIIRSNGADGVATLMASQVVTDAQFREICRLKIKCSFIPV